MKEAGASKGDLWKLPFDQLRIIDGFNLRVHNAQYTAKIEEYAETLFNEGWFAHKPMSGLVWGDEGADESLVYIFDGHRRLLAIPLVNHRLCAAGRPLISEVTVIAVPSKKNGKELTSIADLTVAMVQENKSNPPLTYKYAIACKRLADDLVPTGEIAWRLGLFGKWVGASFC